MSWMSIRIRQNDADTNRSGFGSTTQAVPTVLLKLQKSTVDLLFFRETVEKLKKIRDDRRTGTGDIQQGEISSSEGVLPKEILGEYFFPEQNPVFGHIRSFFTML